MVRGLVFLAIVGGIAVVAAPSAAPSAVPDDVQFGLINVGIELVDARDIQPTSLHVSARQARRAAVKQFGGFARPYTSGWVRVGRVTIHLVRIVRSNSSALVPDQVVWLVLVRDATIPILGRRPGSPGPPYYIGMLAVFVRTDRPSYLEAVSF